MCDSTHQLNSRDELVDGVHTLNIRQASINFWCNIHRHDCTRLLLLNTQKTKHCVRVNGVQQRFQFDTSVSGCRIATWRRDVRRQRVTCWHQTKYVPLSRSSYFARMKLGAERFISVASFIPQQRKLGHTSHKAHRLLLTEIVKTYCASLAISSFSASSTVELHPSDVCFVRHYIFRRRNYRE